MVESLFQIGEGLIGMHEIAENGTLYARSCHYDNIISRSAKFVNQECFYGRSIGFQVNLLILTNSRATLRYFFS